MKLRTCIVAVIALLVPLAAAGWIVSHAAAGNDRPPNVVLLVLDTTRESVMVSPYGRRKTLRFEGRTIDRAAWDLHLVERAVEAGADALVVANTLPAMRIDLETRRPALGNVTGGLSGPAIRPIAVRMVYEVHRAVEIPIIGIGGITCLQDALEFFLAGASAIQVGTANFTDPGTAVRLIDDLERYCSDKGIVPGDLVGQIQTDS